MVLSTTAVGLAIRNIEAARGAGIIEQATTSSAAWRCSGQLPHDPLRNERCDWRSGESRRDAVEIIGVTTVLGMDPAGVDQDNRVIIPYGTAMRRVFDIPYMHALYVQAARTDDLASLEREVRAILQRRLDTGRGAPDTFVVPNQAMLLRAERGAVRAMTRLLVAVVAVTLLLGGVGIVAGMPISLRDRVSEIGLRRAVGRRAVTSADVRDRVRAPLHRGKCHRNSCRRGHSRRRAAVRP